ncbi:MAG TPA: biotin--[acetyl-CoA-carboxylase] ligase [Terriglobales bacterium]|nr:biotin--[acetyl-CoA-carboxylase] ligase [Terriglobales bacterium]
MRLDQRLDRIVNLLVDHRTVVVSGSKIAQEIGTTGKQVWRLIQLLRRLGVDIEGRPATGYVLRTNPDLLLPSILGPLLHSSMFAPGLHHYYKIGSTNAAAMKAAADGAPEGTVFVAEEQTAGRGRGGHTWYSARGAGIYCSVVLRPALAPADSLLISLAAALAVSAAVTETKPDHADFQPDLKWPNDLLIEGKKFCGILTEMNAEPTRVRYLVVGIGINVNHARFPVELQDEATSLRLASGSVWSRVDLTAALLKSVHLEYRRLLSGSRDALLRRFCEMSSMVRGTPVWVDENGGFQGVTEGLDTRGFLQVRTNEGLRTVLSGTVRPLKTTC